MSLTTAHTATLQALAESAAKEKPDVVARVGKFLGVHRPVSSDAAYQRRVINAIKDELNRRAPPRYTATLSEYQNDDLDTRISTVAKKYGKRDTETMTWAIDNHNLFLMMREFLNEEMQRRDLLQAEK